MDLMNLVRDYIDPQARFTSADEVRVRCPSPEHNDRSPSCDVNLTKRVFVCRSCGASGTLSKALFWCGAPKEHLHALADMPRPERPRPPPFYFISDAVLACWEDIPWEWVREGFCPDLLAEHEIGFDRVNDRITVPIRDAAGRLIAVSGRTIHEDVEPRYKVYRREFGEYVPPNYHPRNRDVLWRHHFLSGAEEYVVVAEGFKAAMWLAHAGEPAVAIMGARMTESQTNALVGMQKPVYLFLDSDEAGRKGRERAAISLYGAGVDVRHVLYDAPAPDDLTLAQIRAAMEAALPHWRVKNELGTTSSFP